MVTAGNAIRGVAESMPAVLARFDAAVDPFVLHHAPAASFVSPERERMLGDVVTTVDGLQTAYGPALPTDAVAGLAYARERLVGLQAAAGGGALPQEWGSPDRFGIARSGLAQALASASAIDAAGGTAAVVHAGGLQAVDGAGAQVGDLLLRDTISQWDSSYDHLRDGASGVRKLWRTADQRAAGVAHGDRAIVAAQSGRRSAMVASDPEAQRVVGASQSTSSGGYYLAELAGRRTSLFAGDERRAVVNAAQQLRRQRNEVAELVNAGSTGVAPDWLRGDAAGQGARMAGVLAGADLATPAGMRAVQESLVDGLASIHATWFQAPESGLAHVRRAALRPVIEQVAAAATALDASPAFAAAPEAQLVTVRSLARRAAHMLESLDLPRSEVGTFEPPFDMERDLVERAVQSMRLAPPDAPVSAATHPFEWALRNAEAAVRDADAPVGPAHVHDALEASVGLLRDLEAVDDAQVASRLGGDWQRARRDAVVASAAARLQAIADSTAPADSLVRTVTRGAAARLAGASPDNRVVEGARRELGALADHLDELRALGSDLDAFAGRQPLHVPGSATGIADALDAWAAEAGEVRATVVRLAGEAPGLRQTVDGFANTVLRTRLAPVVSAGQAAIAGGPLVTRTLADLRLTSLEREFTSGKAMQDVVGAAHLAAESVREAATAPRVPLTLAAAAERLPAALQQLDVANAAAADYTDVPASLGRWTAALDELDRTYAPLLPQLPAAVGATMRSHIDGFATEVAAARVTIGASTNARLLPENQFPKLAHAAQVQADARLLDAMVGEGVAANAHDAI